MVNPAGESNDEVLERDIGSRTHKFDMSAIPRWSQLVDATLSLRGQRSIIG
jgi:hypothetical protein